MPLKRLFHAIRKHLPQRRLRFWRYVSPQRRGAGAISLALLVALAYGYWYVTNGAIVRRQAVSYLTELTGGDAKVGDAHFSLFDGIELRDVRVYIPGEQGPFFRAPRVLLRHMPWGLLRGKLDVTQIVCVEPVVTLEQDVQDGPNGSWNYQKLFGLDDPDRKSLNPQLTGVLPSLAVQNARLVLKYKNGWKLEKSELELNMSGSSPGPGQYRIQVENRSEGKMGLYGSVQVNLATGEITPSGTIELGSVSDALLRRFGQWAQRYKMRGRVTLEGKRDPRDANSDVLRAQLDHASLHIPLPAADDATADPNANGEDGALDLLEVRGKIELGNDGVRLRDCTGRIAQLGNASFCLDGRYDGFGPAGAFDVCLGLKDLHVPEGLGRHGKVADALRYIHEHYKFKDLMLDANVHLSRSPEGVMDLRGEARPKAISVMDCSFPWPLTDFTGEVVFDLKKVEMRRLAGRHGNARVEINGRILNPGPDRTWDIRLEARDVDLDDELHQALPPDMMRVWRTIEPRGVSDANIHLYRAAPGEAEKLEVDLIMRGKASLNYVGFPYRLDNMIGKVHFGGGVASIESLTGGDGQTKCTIDGNVVFVSTGKQPRVDLRIEGRAPIDDRLVKALGSNGEDAFEALHPTGMIRRFDAQITQTEDTALEYQVETSLENASFAYSGLPYAVSDANGLLVFRPHQVTVERISGFHKATPIGVTGSILYGPSGTGVDLVVKAEDLKMDDELEAALPQSVKRFWQKVSPNGLADLTVFLRGRTGMKLEDMDYACLIDAKDLQIRYEGFPYPFRHVAGEVLVMPSRIELDGLTAQDGNMRASLSGTIAYGQETDRALLRVNAVNVPLDAELIAALPTRAIPFFGRLKPGGQCDVDFSRLLVVSPSHLPATATAPAAIAPAPPTASAEAEADGNSQWLVEGLLALRNADADLGLGRRTLSGSLCGSGGRTSRGARVDANVLIDKVVVDNRTVSDVSGHLSKKAASDLVRVEDIAGKVYGGRMTGFAEIRVGEPTMFGFRIFAQGMDMHELANAGNRDGNTAVRFEGVLDATLEVKASDSPNIPRQATGRLVLYRSSVQELPVLVDLLQPIFLTLPGEGGFTEGEATYVLRDNKLSFREVYLRGPGMSIVGSGTVNLKTEAIKFTFLSRSGLLPRVANLAGEFIQGILGELMEIQATGTLKNPKFRPVALRSLDAVISKILHPDSDKD